MLIAPGRWLLPRAYVVEVAEEELPDESVERGCAHQGGRAGRERRHHDAG